MTNPRSSAVLMAIDPGLTGAIAVYDPIAGAAFMSVYDMPTKQVTLKSGKKRKLVDAVKLGELIDGVTAGRDVIAAVEKVSAMPGQGVTSMFTFGRALGTIHGALGGAGIDVAHEPTPQQWQKALTGFDRKDKDDHRRIATKLWPKGEHFFRRKKDDGRADAALILSWLIKELS